MSFRAARLLFLALCAAFLAAPLVIVTGVSLDDTSRMSFPPAPPSIRWYEAFFSDSGWLSALTTSLLVASTASVVSVSIAFPVAYTRWKYASRWSQGLEAIARLTFLLPIVVLAMLFLVFWSWLGHVGHIENVIASHALIFVALPLTTLGMGFRAVDRTLIEAARTMGARDEDVLRTVLRPLVFPYVMSGALFVFVLSLNEYVIAYMIAGFEVQTLPIKVFNSLRMGYQPTMCVGAVLFAAAGALVFGLVALIGDLPNLLGGKRG
jgi:putative spermidine/putrescine transport system permease protein